MPAQLAENRAESLSGEVRPGPAPQLRQGFIGAGQAEHRLGGGRIIEPMRLVIGDRVTWVKEFDVGEIAVETARGWFRDHLSGIDPSGDLIYQVELKGGSEELTGIFREASTIAAARKRPRGKTPRVMWARYTAC